MFVGRSVCQSHHITSYFSVSAAAHSSVTVGGGGSVYGLVRMSFVVISHKLAFSFFGNCLQSFEQC